jgi:hypothetical protein
MGKRSVPGLEALKPVEARKRKSTEETKEW